MDKRRILITGFQPFPGAPYNPTEKLVDRLLRLRRSALDDIERIGHVFPVTYAAVDRELPALIAAHKPDAPARDRRRARVSAIAGRNERSRTDSLAGTLWVASG